MATRAQAWGAAMLITLILIVAQGMEARGQDRVFDISALQKKVDVSIIEEDEDVSEVRMGTFSVASRQAGPVLNDQRIAQFQNLNSSITYYYNEGGINDFTSGSNPQAVYVDNTQLNQLQRDARSEKLQEVRLLVVQLVPGQHVSSLASALSNTDTLPALEFIVFRFEADPENLSQNNVQRNSHSESTIQSSLGGVFGARPNLIVVYNNLELAQ